MILIEALHGFADARWLEACQYPVLLLPVLARFGPINRIRRALVREPRRPGISVCNDQQSWGTLRWAISPLILSSSKRMQASYC